MNHLKTASPGACRFVLLVLLATSARLSHAADTTPPTIPTNFTAVVAACSRVDLNWAAAADPKSSQSGLAGYKVYRNASVIATLGLVTSFSDTNLLASTQYSYNVSALDIAGNESPLSSVVAVTPCADTTAPGSPASITPSVVNSSQVDISWAGATDNSGAKYETVSGIKNYQVFRSGTNANNKIADVAVPSTFFSDTGLAANQTVYYAVRAVDNNNNVSGFRISSSVTTSFGAPGSVTGITASTPNCRSVHLDWNAPASVGSGLAYYQVFRDGGALQQTSSTSLSDNSVNPGASYTYSIAAVDTGGRSSAPQPFLVTVPGCPASPPSNLRIDMDNGSRLARLYWSGTPGALYQAQCASTFFGPWIPVDAPTTQFSVTNLAAQPSSIYRVAIFTNTPAYVANFIPNIYDTAAPPTPANLSVNAVSDTEASLTWDTVTDNGTTDLSGNTYTSGIDRYLIYRDGIFLKNEPPSATSSSDLTVEADATYTYTLASIDKAGNRSGFIGGTVQIKKSCAYTLSYAAMTFGSAGGSSNATVTAGPNCAWSVSTGNSWLHSNGNGNGNGNLTLTVDANGSASPRQGTISVGNKTLSITQNGVTCSYTLIPSGANHGSDAENGGFSILAPAGCNWSASAGASWLHTSSGGSGNGTVTYTVDANTGTRSRSGQISAGGQNFTVIQGGVNCSYAVAPTGYSHGSGSEGGSFSVTADAGCAWSASASDPWIHTTSDGTGDGTVSYTIDANPSIVPRSSQILAGGQPFSISQAGVACSYEFTPPGFSHASGSENGSFSVTTPAGCTWSASSGATWIHTTSSGSGNGTVSYSVDANPSTTPRSDQILAGGNVFSVSQVGISCSYSVFPSSNNHGADAENGSFLVSAPGGCAWSASTIASWIHTTSTGSGNGTASYAIDPNASTSARSAQVVVGGQSFTVNQSGISCTYFLSSSANNHGAGAENGSFSITTPNGCAWFASPSAGWIHTSSSGTGNGTVNYSIDSNGSTSSRSGQILVGGQSFTVNQSGQALTLGGALDNTGLTWTSGGNAPWAAENSVAFSAGAAAQSGAIGNAQLSWLETTVTGPSTLSFYWKVSSEFGYDLLHFYLDGVEQTGVTAISGEVDWQQKSVAIGSGAHVAHWEYAKDGVCCSGGADAGWVDLVQVTASACAYSISPGSASIAASGGPGSFAVTTSGGCAWSASTSFGWIHTSSAGNGSGTVTFTVDANGLTGARSGTIIVGTQTYSISQAGANCTYGLGSSSASYNSATASGSVTVTAGAGCGWGASSGAGWIHTASSGTGNGAVSYNLDANASGAARSGTISVAGQSFQVNQSVDVAPVANAGSDISVSLGALASFNAGASSDADGSIISYQWDFGDGTTGSGVAVTHAYGSLGIYTVRLTVTDDLGATGTDAALATIVALPDLTPPTVSLALPGGTNVSGMITLTATASDNVSVAKVEFYRDGVLFTNDTTSPFIVAFDTRILANGAHTFLAKAYDPSNNNNSSSVTVLVDNMAPTTALTAPANGSTVNNTITLTASATDNSGGSGVARVEFYCDNNSSPIGTATTTPWTAPCDTTLMANGSHAFYSKAYDLAGNAGSSPAVTVAVNNTVVVNPGQLLWLKTMLCQNGNAVSTGIAADHAGNVIVVGYFNGTVNLGSGPISSTFANNVTDGFIVKYAPDGTLVWIKRFGGSGNDSAQAVVIDSQNNIIVSGNFQGTVDFGGGPVTAVSSSEMFAVKYSTSGGFMWGSHYAGLTSNTGSSMAIDGSDNVVLAANCGYNANFGGTLLTPAGGAADIDVALGKISSSTGATLWAKRFGGVNWDYVRAVAVDRSGDIVVVGYFTSSTDLGAGTVNGGGGFDIFLAKFSGANGAYRWGKTFGGTGGDFGYGVAIDPNTGNAVMTGLFAGSVDFGGGLAGAGGVFLAAYDPTGNFLWTRTTGAGSDSGAAITIDSNGNMAVTGRANNALYFGGSQSLFGNGQVNCFVASFTVSGANTTPTYRWTKYLGEGTDGASAGNAVALDPTGQVLLGGNFLATIDFGGVTTTAAMAGYSSAFLTKYAR